MIAKQSKSDRKSRTKLRKPKFLSLRLQLNATPPPPVPPMSPTTTATDVNKQQQQLINLFPLHPEKLADDEHNMAACIFSSCDDVDRAATTLTGILRSDDEDDEENGNRNGNRNTDNPSPSSVNYADEEVELVRTAMRRNVSDKTDDEKWVCYSEVVERKKEIISSSSSSTTTTSNWYSNVNGNGSGNHRNRSKLVLKLDYDKVMECWVNKGPLYIHGDGSGNGNGNSDAPQPQTVPDLHDDHDFFWGTRHDEQDNGANAGSWTVPEMTHIESSGMSRGDDALQAGDSSAMMHNREASVQRYKEKRRNRLFAKTIRYEVRKLNAEKRPRIKGRFVKRN